MKNKDRKLPIKPGQKPTNIVSEEEFKANRTIIKVPRRPKLKDFNIKLDTKTIKNDDEKSDTKGMKTRVAVKEPRVVIETEKVQSGTEKVQIGTKKVQSGTKSIPVYGMGGTIQIKYNGRSRSGNSTYLVTNTSGYQLLINDVNGQRWIIFPNVSGSNGEVPSYFRDPCTVSINGVTLGKWNMVDGQNINQTWNLASIVTSYRQEPVYKDEPVYEERPVYKEVKNQIKGLLMYIK